MSPLTAGDFRSLSATIATFFPGWVWAFLLRGRTRVSDSMFMAAARALADYAMAGRDPAAPLLPSLAESRQVSRAIALAVAAAAGREGLVRSRRTEELERLVNARMWQPRYLPITLAKPV